MQNRNIKQESVCAAECVIDSCHSNCSCFPVSGYSARSKNKKKDVLVHLEAGSSVPHRYMSALLSTAAGSVLQDLPCWAAGLCAEGRSREKMPLFCAF